MKIEPSIPTRGPALSIRSGSFLSRRALLGNAIGGVGGLFLAEQMALGAGAHARPTPAKAVIQIWMWGGPCHIDTFDPKPEAGYDYCGPLDKAISTNVDGIRIGQSLPELAKQADKYAIVRSMTHDINAHETASYMVQTGRNPGGRLVYPCAGAVVSLFKGYDSGYEGLIPPYIVLTEPQGRFSEAGFLEQTHKPFATGGDPAMERFVVEGVVAEGVSDQRQRERRDLLKGLNTFGRAIGEAPAISLLQESEEQAYDLILGDGARVFDLRQENDKLREEYGRNTFGQSCIMARRLVENGVRYVTINYKGWDTHKQHFPIMRRMLPELDRGMATLLRDLSDRGLLDSTVVWWGGEFGRTPRVQWEAPWNGGRGHYGRCFSAVVAGGGFQGGTVVGASDERGGAAIERPVYPVDLLASIYELMGIDPEARMPNPRGLDVRVAASSEEGVQSYGRLTEIMKQPARAS